GPYFFTTVAVATFARRYLVNPPRLELDASGQSVRGVTAIVQNGSPFTYFRDRPIEVAEGATLDSGALAAAVLRRASPLGMPSLGWRALSGSARVVRHRQV